MKNTNLYLQLLAEEMPATSGGAEAQGAADAQSQVQSAPAPAAEGQQGETFEALTGKGGRFEKEYGAAVQKAVRARMRGAQETQRMVERMQPLVELIGQQYGVDVSDLGKVDFESLGRMLTDDERWYEKDAMDAGVSVDQIKRQRSAERQNSILQREVERLRGEREQRQKFDTLRESFRAVQERYPQADLTAEIGNRAFMSLLASGFEPMQAYEAAHSQELQQAAMQYGVQRTQAQVAANGQRPPENALGAPAGQTTKIDPGKLTPQQRAELRARVARGERITF